MDQSIVLLAAFWLTALLPLGVEPKPISKVTVMGSVFCDTCSNNAFSKQSYFLQGAEVNVECKFKANSTAEQVHLSVNRTTDKFGIYAFELPSFVGFKCKVVHEVGLFCKASLVRSSTSCNVPGVKRSTEHMAIKSKQDSVCIYSLNALSYNPAKRDLALCGADKGESPSSLNASKFFLPPFPPFGFPFPQLPPLPPFPQLPPFPPFPQLPPLPQLPPFPPLPPLPPLPQLPPLPSLPFPFHFPPFPCLNPPASPFPFPPSLPLPPTPSLLPPPPPPSPTNPRSWFPFLPSTPPPPPYFSLTNPRTWFRPPSPPNYPQSQHP